MRKFFALGICCCSVLLSAAQVDLNIRWLGGKIYQFKDNVLIVKDNSATAGNYVLSPQMIPVDPSLPLRIKAQIKCENVTSRSHIYIRAVDKQGKILKLFSAGSAAGTCDWRDIDWEMPAGKLPAGTAGVLLMLQPAAGAASATGTAYFRNMTLVNEADSAGTLRWRGRDFKLQDEYILVSDNSVDGGNYITAVLSDSVDFSSGLRISVQAKCENNSGRTQVYLFAVDKQGKRIAVFASNHITGNCDWRTLSIIADEIPAGTDKLQLNLQPAAGPAAGTGTAYFRNLSIEPMKKAEALDGIESTAEVAVKYGNINLYDRTLKAFPFEHTPKHPRLEIMQSVEKRAGFLQLVCNQKNPEIRLSVWDASGEFFRPLTGVKIVEKNNSLVIDLNDLPPWRKLALDFPKVKKLDLETLRFYRKQYPEENWLAYWIWYTSKRVENETVYLRKDFELEQVPDMALFQGAIDDGGNIYINGKRVVNILGRFAPPNIDIVRYLRPGKNTICAIVHQARYAAGLLCEVDMRFADGSSRKLITDKSWKYFRGDKVHDDWNKLGFDASSWGNCVELARPPLGAWGKVEYKLNSPRREMTVSGEMLPDTIEAGKVYKVKINTEMPPDTPDTPLRLTLKRDGNLFYNWDLGVLKKNKKMQISCDIVIGKYLAPGEYDLDFSISGLQAVSSDKKNINHRKIRVINDRRAEAPEAKIAPFGNVPTLHINGKPYSSFFSAKGGKELELHGRIFNAADLHLYHVYLTPQWNGPDQMIFSRMDVLANDLLNGDPDAYFLVKIAMRDATVPWMYDQHPGDSVVFDDLNVMRKNKMSIASKARRKIFSDYIRNLIIHVNSSPYADRVIGYFANEGEEGQWMHYWNGGDPSVKGSLSDYSEAMKDYFRSWLKKNYAAEKDLQKAWNDPSVTFETAQIPSREMRIAAGMGAFRDPVKNRPAIDYAFALSDVITEGVIYYAKLIKEVSGNKALTGALYGHLVDLGGHFLGEQVGYLRQKEAVRTPYVDYYLGPLHYGAPFRDQGGVGSFDMPSPDTLALYNKIWINENDIRTHLEFPAGYAHSIRTPYATTHVLAREVGKALCGRAGFYYFPLGEGFANWFDDPETIQTIRELKQVSDQALPLDRSSASEIAVFISDESVGCLRLKSNSKIDRYMNFAIYQRENIGRIGAPFDEYLQFDIASEKLKDYKFYIFLNPYKLTVEERSAIEKIAADPEKKILFVFAPGIMEENGVSLNWANKVAKMDFTMLNEQKKLSFELKTPCGALASGYRFGNTETAGPVPVPQQFDELLASYTDGTPAVVRKGNIYYTTAGLLPPEVLRKMAESAAVEILSDDNIAVYRSQSLLAFHSSKKTGDFSVKAPAGKKMRQIWPVRKNAAEIEEYRWQNDRPRSGIFILSDN